METNKVIEELHQKLADAGFKSSMVAAEHLNDLQHELNEQLAQGSINREFYDEIISRYDIDWDFEPRTDLPMAQSIIIVAAPQPKVRIKFELSGNTLYATIPPTYLHDVDAEVLHIIESHLKDHGYTAYDAILPEKLLAVNSGLARYGRNNIAYIDDWGSYFRIKAYISDVPLASDNWQEVKMLERCTRCSLCLKKCPTGAIHEESFLIHAEQCLTFFNEGSKEFPGWIDSSWHNCLIGCMVCQDVCPINKDQIDWIIDGEEFSEEETMMILEGESKSNLPRMTFGKLKRLYMVEYHNLLSRNLGALIKGTS